MAHYDVALWRSWPSHRFPLVEEVEAETPLLAVLSLMASHNLKHVARAGVKLPAGRIRRFENGVRLFIESGAGCSSLEQEEEG